MLGETLYVLVGPDVLTDDDVSSKFPDYDDFDFCDIIKDDDVFLHKLSFGTNQGPNPDTGLQFYARKA